jgi:hypothetical protein
MNRDCQEQFDMLSAAEKKMLRMWVDYMNAWFQADGIGDIRVTLDDFFSTEWRETFSIATVETGWHNLVTMSAGYGDDGGPSILTAWVIAPGYPGSDDDDPRISALAQDFDTMPTMVYTAEDGWAHWPEGVEKP